MESIPVWGATSQQTGTAPACRKRLGRRVHGERHQPGYLVGARLRCRDGARALARAAGAVQGATELHRRAVQRCGDQRGHPSRTDGQPAVRRAADERPGDTRRDQLRSSARQPARGIVHSTEPRARLRAADDRLSRDELLDGLRLPHLVDEPHVAGAHGGVPVARVRLAVREPWLAAQPQPPRSREGAGVGPQDEGERLGPREARRISDQRAGARTSY